MYRYEKLEVYKRAKDLNIRIIGWMRGRKGLEFYLRNQLGRAALSIMLNIAEGSGRMTDPDQRRFYVISRSSLFEVSAIFDLVAATDRAEDKELREIQEQIEVLSRQLYTMIRSLSK